MVKVAGFIFLITQQTVKLSIKHSLYGKLKQTLSKKQQVDTCILADESVMEKADPWLKCFYKFEDQTSKKQSFILINWISESALLQFDIKIWASSLTSTLPGDQYIADPV